MRKRPRVTSHTQGRLHAQQKEQAPCLKIKSLKMVTQDTNLVWFSLTREVLRVTHKSELPRMVTDVNVTS